MDNASEVALPDQAAPSLLCLPLEVRIKIYRHILPPHAGRFDYLGLRQSCSLIRQEFRWLTLENFIPKYHALYHILRKSSILILSSPQAALYTFSLSIAVPLGYLDGPTPLPTALIPFHWLSLSKVIIVFDAQGRQFDNKTYNLFRFGGKLDRYIKRETVQKVGNLETLKKPVSIKEITFMWINVPPGVRTPQPSDYQVHGKSQPPTIPQLTAPTGCPTKWKCGGLMGPQGTVVSFRWILQSE